jgi:beta-barrel assembly-enhancing protease
VGVGAARLRPRPAAVAALALLLPACISEPKELALGDSVAEEINAQIPLVDDELLNRFITALGGTLARTSKRPDLPYRFYIVNTPEVNAFAIPGGHIYLTRGLIERTRNVPELAGVIGHEVAHVAARHGIQKLERYMRTSSLMGSLYDLFLGGQPALLRHRSLMLGGRLWYLSHSREDEREADRLAVRYLTRSGFDPSGMVSLMERLLVEEGETPVGLAELFQTHPFMGQRIEVVRSEIVDLEDQTPPELLADLPNYDAFLRRLRAVPYMMLPASP